MSVSERRDKAAELGISLSQLKSGQWRPGQSASSPPPSSVKPPKPTPTPSPSSSGGGRTSDQRAQIAADMSTAERRDKAQQLGISLSELKSGQWRPGQSAVTPVAGGGTGGGRNGGGSQPAPIDNGGNPGGSTVDDDYDWGDWEDPSQWEDYGYGYGDTGWDEGGAYGGSWDTGGAMGGMSSDPYDQKADLANQMAINAANITSQEKMHADNLAADKARAEAEAQMNAANIASQEKMHASSLAAEAKARAQQAEAERRKGIANIYGGLRGSQFNPSAQVAAAGIPQYSFGTNSGTGMFGNFSFTPRT